MTSEPSVRARTRARRLPRGWRVPHRRRIPRHRPVRPQIRPRRRVPWGWWRIGRRRCNRRSVSGPTTACDAVHLLAVQLIGYAIARPRGVLFGARRTECAGGTAGRSVSGGAAVPGVPAGGAEGGGAPCWTCARPDAAAANNVANNQNCQDMVHGAHSRKGRSSLHLHSSGSGRVLLSNTYPLHAAIDGDP